MKTQQPRRGPRRGGGRGHVAAPARVVALGLLLALALDWRFESRAQAYDPATTHAGLTQQAAAASLLHQVLALRLGRPLGLFEPVSLHAERLTPSERRLLLARLGALDPAGGYRPGDDGVAPALAFVVAGSVIAKMPPESVQHLFFDPSTGSGLKDSAGADGFFHSLRLIADAGGSVRQLATGTGFALEGEPSLKWLDSSDNDLGLPVFHQQLERALSHPDPAERSSALARALLALGGVLTVLEDAGNPAQVRNDFRGSYLQGRTGSPFDRWSRFERGVADFYGMGGIPAPREIVRRPTLRAFFTDPDGQGLADRTQRRFFSDGTVPADGIIDTETTGADVVREARQSLTYGLPIFSHLDLRESGVRRYVTVVEGKEPPRKILAYERVPGRIRFFLDGRVYADSARVLLPEIAGYAAGLIDHLLRGEVKLAREGDSVRATLVDPVGSIRGGTLRLLSEDASGRRSEIAAFPADRGAPESVSVVVPAGSRRIAAVLRGWDAAGPVVAGGELVLPPPPRR